MDLKRERQREDKKETHVIGKDKFKKLHYLAGDGISVCGVELYDAQEVIIDRLIHNTICLTCKIMLCYTENKYKVIKRRGTCSCSCMIISALSVESDKVRFKDKQYIQCPLCGKSVIMDLGVN